MVGALKIFKIEFLRRMYGNKTFYFDVSMWCLAVDEVQDCTTDWSMRYHGGDHHKCCIRLEFSYVGGIIYGKIIRKGI